MLDTNYQTYINSLIDNQEVTNNQLTFDMYLTLIALNNHHYKKDLNEITIIENFLRKVNNLKVKIQLKRREIEIDEVLNDIKPIYEQNKTLIEKYNEDNIDIINILDSKEPLAITNIIDKLTKFKQTKVINEEKYDKLRNEIINNIFNTEYQINTDTFTLNDISIPLDTFYEIFDYLLDINNYEEVYRNEIANHSRTKIITDIINKINEDTPLNNYLPVILTSLFTKNLNSTDINTTKFNIDNIKISELYNLANNNNQNNYETKWKNVTIPNEYLYQKIKIMVTTGMYYFNNNIFIMELPNDFKISILTEDLINFIKENILKHI